MLIPGPRSWADQQDSAGWPSSSATRSQGWGPAYFNRSVLGPHAYCRSKPLLLEEPALYSFWSLIGVLALPTKLEHVLLIPCSCLQHYSIGRRSLSPPRTCRKAHFEITESYRCGWQGQDAQPPQVSCHILLSDLEEAWDHHLCGEVHSGPLSSWPPEPRPLLGSRYSIPWEGHVCEAEDSGSGSGSNSDPATCPRVLNSSGRLKTRI